MWRPDRWTALAAMMAIAHFASFPARTHPIATDIRYYVYYAAELARGRVLYRDTFDPKGPFAPVVGAALHRLAMKRSVPIRLLGDPPRLSSALASVGAVGAFLLASASRGRPRCPRLRRPGGLSRTGLLGSSCSRGSARSASSAWTACVIAALFVAQRAWLLAGIAAGIAVLDRQIGAVAVAATLAASLCTERHVRAAAAARVVAGVRSRSRPWSRLRGGTTLGDALRAPVAAFAQHTSGTRRRDCRSRAPVGAGEQCVRPPWLFAAGLAGIPVYAGSLTRSRRDPTRAAPMLAIGLCQLAILALSAWELQGYGDLFALLHWRSADSR
ncbi:MAG: hypothetical protein U0610_03520 [bacterium]